MYEWIIHFTSVSAPYIDGRSQIYVHTDERTQVSPGGHPPED